MVVQDLRLVDLLACKSKTIVSFEENVSLQFVVKLNKNKNNNTSCCNNDNNSHYNHKTNTAITTNFFAEDSSPRSAACSILVGL